MSAQHSQTYAHLEQEVQPKIIIENKKSHKKVKMIMSSGFSTATLKFRSQWDITFKMTHGTWTTERGLTVGEKGGLGGGGQKGRKLGQL